VIVAGKERRTGQHRSNQYRKQYGGNPQFNHRGDYVGFTLSPGED